MEYHTSMTKQFCGIDAKSTMRQHFMRIHFRWPTFQSMSHETHPRIDEVREEGAEEHQYYT
jgi:hypothetical protein